MNTEEIETFNRPPRILRRLPAEEVEIPNPPNRSAFSRLPSLAYVILPAITGVFYLIALVARGGQGGNIWLSLPIVVVSFISVAIGVWNYRNQIREQEKAKRDYENTYNDALNKIRTRLKYLTDEQKRVLIENDPEPTKLLEIARGDGTLPQSRLWERRPADEDFLRLRIGIGTVPPVFKIKPPRVDILQFSPELKQALELVKEFAEVRDVPITIPLRTYGSLGIAGSDDKVVAFTRALIWQIAVHHSPNEVRLAAFWSSAFDRYWSWLRHLPHTRAFEDTSYRLLARYDVNQSHFEQIVSVLKHELRQRIEHGVKGRPHVVIVLDSYPKFKAQCDTFLELLTQGRDQGFSFFFLVQRSRQTPDACGGYIELQSRSMLALTGNEGGRKEFREDAVSLEDSERLARMLAGVSDVTMATRRELPRQVRFSTLLNLGDVKQFNPKEHWDELLKSLKDSWHPVPVGVTGPELSRDRFEINLNEGFHGVHGIIAGTTGSGKSEFLLTFLMSLAVYHSPDRLNLMLIDFKGGATFKILETLPHTVGVVTDLEGYEAERALIAINSELDRRKRKLQHYNVANIREYRRLAKDKALPPIPNLMIAIDEFDEMVRDYPDFVTELIRVAKQGRSLGVHLLFATQQPSMVKEGLLRNLTYWIALRVTSTDDSKLMVQIPDAAYLTTETPGRGYFRVNKEVIAFQSARVTIPYQPQQQGDVGGFIDETGRRYVVQNIAADFRRRVEELCSKTYNSSDRLITLIIEEYKEAVERGTLPTPSNMGKAEAIIREQVQRYLERSDSAVIDEMIARLHAQHDEVTEFKLLIDAMERVYNRRRYAAETYKVWMEPLPEQLTLAEVQKVFSVADDAWMQAPVGLLDYPTLAEQQPLVLDLVGQHGNVLVVGAAGSGKTFFLRTLMVSLAYHHSPDELWIYTIDGSGRGCGLATPQGRLVHIADTLIPQDSERIERLLFELDSAVEERIALLRKYGVDTLTDYRRLYQRAPDRSLPPPPHGILIVIDNFAELSNAQPESTIEAIIALMRRGRSLGISVVTTTSLLKDMGRFQTFFETKIALRVNSDDESTMLVGKPVAFRIRQPGRAFLRTSEGPVELQVALPVLPEMSIPIKNGERGFAPDLRADFEQLREVITGKWQRSSLNNLPQPLRLLPAEIRLEELLTEVEPPLAPFARDGLRLKPISFDLSNEIPHLLIAGGSGVGKSTALRSILTAIMLRSHPDETRFILIDYRRQTLLPFANLPFKYDEPVRIFEGDVPHIPFPPNSSQMQTALKALQAPEHAKSLGVAVTEGQVAGLCLHLRDELNQRLQRLSNLDSQDHYQVDRPRLILVVNDLDLMIGQELNYLTLLTPFAMRGDELGFHVIMTATDFSSWQNNQLIKTLKTSRCSLYLGKPLSDVTKADPKEVESVGIKWPKSLANASFPPGRGLALWRGQQMLIQVAVPMQLLGSSALDGMNQNIVTDGPLSNLSQVEQ